MTGTPGAPAPAAGGKPLAKLGSNPRAKLAAGAAGLVVIIALAQRSAAGSSSATSTDPTTGGGQLTPNQGGYYDSTANDVAQSLGGQIQGLQAQIDALSPGASTIHLPAPAPKPKPKPAPKPKPKPKPAPKPKPKPKQPTHNPAPRPAPKVKPLTYTVRAGDNLSTIVKRVTGSSNWRPVYNANRKTIGSNPNRLRIGERLTLPGRPAPHKPAPKPAPHKR